MWVAMEDVLQSERVAMMSVELAMIAQIGSFRVGSTGTNGLD